MLMHNLEQLVLLPEGDTAIMVLLAAEPPYCVPPPPFLEPPPIVPPVIPKANPFRK